MTRVPMTATIEPIISYVSGFFLSTILPQMIVDTMNMPPYAAYTYEIRRVVKSGLSHRQRE